MPQEVIDGFAKETGIKVNVENYASNEEMLSKLLAGGSKYDLVQPSEYTVESLIKAEKLEPLTAENIPNLKNLDPKFAKMPHDPEGKYSVPWMAGTVGIVVNTAKVKTPITGYKDVFDGTHKRRIVVLNDSREIVSWALATLGIGPNDMTPENLDKAKPILSEWLPQVKVYDSDSPKTAFLNGDVDLGIVWSGEAAILWKKDKKFTYVLPAEGAHQFIDSLCVPKGAPNKENAEKFINYILKPEVSVLISKEFPYTNPNAEAVKLLKPEQRANPASYPSGDLKLETFKDIGKAAKDIDKVVTDLKGRKAR
ncbi:MAG: spermidine/putrescine ABC transporter substrate-binding protein [Chthoniobacter sp.]|nr:spermidine/putrescine ABC transporter substrate-binding protein [Chthoniobacter sp.]